MTAAFPSTLWGPTRGTLQKGVNDGIVEDSGEIGPKRKRRRTTRALRNWSFTFRLPNSVHKATWDEFYENTITFGLENFTWSFDGSTYTVQLLSPPSLRHVDVDIYDVSISIGEI